MKLPAIQFYPADWRKDPGVQSLDYFDKGVWFEILCLMHESPERGKLILNGVAMPDAALARILGLDNQTLTKTLTTLLDYGVASRDAESGALINRRMVKDEEIRKVRTEAGKKGGNPALLNQKPTTKDKQIPTTGVNQKSTPSSSSSSSITSSDQSGNGSRSTNPKVEFKAHTRQKRVCASKSKFSLEQVTQYAWAAHSLDQKLKSRGEKDLEGIRNPVGWAVAAHRSGEFDAIIQEWIDDPKVFEVGSQNL